MSGFRAVNTTLTVAEPPPRLEETTPTTPRPTKFFAPSEQPGLGEDAAKTPTRDSFGGLAGQRPLPAAPFAASHNRSDSKMDARVGGSRESSHISNSADSSQDVEMGGDKDGQDSDNESVDGESGRPSKKKKGQRFFCTDFPPCQLSFTRSEHLARHIRKHTGERPFQCHCNRRFSRLDNLRQHAQTVHVNEDIPAESLAATGTRFQRQIRTDRVRTPGNRSRASTLGSQTGHTHGRGHSRNLSSSSITSVSTSTSSLAGDDVMRRPPLAMTSDATSRARLSLDTYNPGVTSSPSSQRYFPAGGQSPSAGYSTPTSATFPGNTGSPRYSSGMHSPVHQAIPRSVGWEPRTPGRRLSVPGNPFTPQGNGTYPAPYISPLPSNSGSVYSGNSSLYASPTSSYSQSRRDSVSQGDIDWRRRTWHPGSTTGLVQRPGTSGLSQYQTPDSPRPVFPSVKSNSQVTRLPGIESFDHAPPQIAITRRVPSPMQLDPPIGPPAEMRPISETMRPDSDNMGGLSSLRNNRISWDTALHKGLTQLDLANTTPPKESPGYGNIARNTPRGPESNSRPTTAPQNPFQNQKENMPFNPRPPSFQPPTSRERLRFSDQPATPRRNKRHAWYNGPVHYSPQSHPSAQPLYSSAGLRTSPDGSSSSEGVPTPSTGSINEYHPAIVHSNGYVEAHPPGYHSEEQPKVEHLTHNQATSEYKNDTLNQFPAPPGAPQQTQKATFALQQAQQAPPAQTQTYPPPMGPPNDLSRLDALVAVATQEESGRL